VLITTAYAAPAAVGSQDLMSFVPLIVIFVLFWFMLIRPQMKQAKEQRSMLAALQKGDEVTTTGGLVGKLTKVDESFVGLEIAAGTVVTVQKNAIQTLLPKGTIKNL
jgi:preprotein translocase subunit YajC